MRTLVLSLSVAGFSATLAAAVGGCTSGHDSSAATAAAPAASAVTAPAAASASAATAARVPGHEQAGEALPWVEDDYARALATARQGGRPLVIDAWAPWCHTCLSMKSFVLKDPSLLAIADRFVWLSIDTEKQRNAAVVGKYPLTAWPTFFVVDPGSEQVHGRWVGSASPAQFRRFLVDGEKTVQMAHAGELPAGDPLAALVTGNRHAAAKRFAEAAAAYREALAKAPADWARRPDALVALLEMLAKTDPSACVDLALSSMKDTGTTSSAADFASYGLDCADKLPPGDARASKVRAEAVLRMRAVAMDPAAPLSADDRGDILRTLWDVLETQGDAAGAKAMAQKRAEVLDAAAAAAPDAHAASTFEWARAETYLYLGRGDEAIRMLEKLEKDLPDDYNPPHHLARTYLNLKQYDKALVAIDRAIAKAYGPRQAGMYGFKADILEAAGRPADARAAVTQQLSAWAALPPPQRRPDAIAAAQAHLTKLTH